MLNLKRWSLEHVVSGSFASSHVELLVVELLVEDRVLQLRIRGMPLPADDLIAFYEFGKRLYDHLEKGQ